MINSEAEPVGACTTLYPSKVIGHFLGYREPSGVTLNTENTRLVAPPNATAPWSLTCAFSDNDDTNKGYEICIAARDNTWPQSPQTYGPGARVSANGATVRGISKGIIPVNDNHLIPLLGGTTLRVTFTTQQTQ